MAHPLSAAWRKTCRSATCPPARRKLFEREVGVQVDVGGLDRLVTEPQRDYGAVDTILQQLHCRSVKCLRFLGHLRRAS